MKKILISAYAVSPIRGSECAVGWEITKRLGKYFDVTVLVCENTPSNTQHYKEIQEYIKVNGSIENVHFIPIKMPRTSKKYTLLHDLGFWPAYYWGYKCWQKEAYRIALNLHAQKNFDITYQLNMIGFREPGYLWKLNVPFIWGPTNGFHSIPFRFINYFNGKEFLLQTLKHIANEFQISIAKRAKKAAIKAEIIWCVDEIALKKLIQWQGKAELMQETGLSTIPDHSKSNRYFDGVRCLNLVWSGMITTGKALSILIDALTQVKDLNFHLTVIGDGPLSPTLKKKAGSLKDKITWTGWLQKNEAIKKVNESDLLIHTSLKEGTPHSILEALGMGVPVICHDTCGMGAVIDEMNGFKIPYIDATTSINKIANILLKIIDNPNILNDRYNSIWTTTTDLTWDSKVKKIAIKIDEILN